MSVRPYNLLDEFDKELISDYIKYYANENHSRSRNTDLEYILRHWDSAKNRYLLPLFDNQLIVRKTVDYEISSDELMREIEKLSIYKEVMNDFYNFINHYYVTAYGAIYNANGEYTPAYSRPDYPNLCQNTYEVRRLMSSWCLAENRYDDCNIKIEDPKRGQGHFINIQTGCKPIKILQKINEGYHFTDKLEDLRLAISVILNKKKIKGELCLSIHPLDYMTMSDNACHWDSCMSWMNDGCYRQGTVEMLNSPMVIVAYLTSSENLRFYDGEWNSKRWRSLYIVSPEFITSIKAYPYENRSLDNVIVSELRKMASQKFGWYYGQIITHDGSHFEEDDCGYYLNLHCNEMYNDFGTCTHTGCIGVSVKSGIDLNYSGYSECVWCGCSSENWEYDGGENSLTCSNCSDVKYCDDCGERIYGDDYYVDAYGNYVCPNCRWNDYDIDIASGELVRLGDLYDVYVLPEDFKEFTKEKLTEILRESDRYSDGRTPFFRIERLSYWREVSKGEFHILEEEKGDAHYSWMNRYYFIFEDEFIDDRAFNRFKWDWADKGFEDYDDVRAGMIEEFVQKAEIA